MPPTIHSVEESSICICRLLQDNNRNYDKNSQYLAITGAEGYSTCNERLCLRLNYTPVTGPCISRVSHRASFRMDNPSVCNYKLATPLRFPAIVIPAA